MDSKLKQQFQQDLNSALKAGESLKRLVLGSLLAAIKNREIEKRTRESKKKPDASQEELVKASELSDEEIIRIIQSEIKKRKEAAGFFKQGDNLELARKEEDEINILLQYVLE